MKSNLKLLGAGIFTAIAASLCCITPVLALISGASGVASTFSWIEPARPYLIGVTVLVLGFAWYQKLKPQQKVSCNCDEKEKPKFMQSKLFLGIVTAFTVLMLAFPYYSSLFYPTVESQTQITEESDIQQIEFSIKGMTCEGCEEHITHAVKPLEGVIEVAASYKEGNALVKYDATQISISSLEDAINNTGYSITQQKKL